jgi:hypothetical protein
MNRFSFKGILDFDCLLVGCLVAVGCNPFQGLANVICVWNSVVGWTYIVPNSCYSLSEMLSDSSNAHSAGLQRSIDIQSRSLTARNVGRDLGLCYFLFRYCPGQASFFGGC